MVSTQLKRRATAQYSDVYGGLMKIKLLGLLMLVFVTPALYANTVTLSWEDSVSTDVVSYNVYRTTQCGAAYQRVNAAPVLKPTDGSMPTYQDTTPQNIQYCYVVRAVNEAGLESVNSNEVAASPFPPAPPTGLKIDSLTNASLQINGTAVVSAPIGTTLQYTLTVPRMTPPRSTDWSLSVTYK